MPRSKDRDGMEVTEDAFITEELCFRFACMPEQIQEEIVRFEDFKQHLVTAILDYKHYFIDRLGSIEAADNRFETLCGQATTMRIKFTKRFHEILRQTGLDQRNSTVSDHPQIVNSATNNSQIPALGSTERVLLVDGTSLDSAGRQQNLSMAQLRRILGDDDYELAAQATVNSPQNHNQALDPTDLPRILGDNDYMIEQDNGEPARHPEQLGAAQIRQILGDDNFERVENQDAQRRRPLETRAKRRPRRRDAQGFRGIDGDEDALRHLQMRLREVQSMERQRRSNFASRH